MRWILFFFVSVFVVVATSSVVAKEEILLKVPEGLWKVEDSETSDNQKTITWLPENEENKNWTRKIEFNRIASDEDTNLEPYMQQWLDEAGSHCDTLKHSKIDIRSSNGFESAVVNLVCSQQSEGDKGNTVIILSKVTKGTEDLFIVRAAVRLPGIENIDLQNLLPYVNGVERIVHSSFVCDNEVPERFCNTRQIGY